MNSQGVITRFEMGQQMTKLEVYSLATSDFLVIFMESVYYYYHFLPSSFSWVSTQWMRLSVVWVGVHTQQVPRGMCLQKMWCTWCMAWECTR